MVAPPPTGFPKGSSQKVVITWPLSLSVQAFNSENFLEAVFVLSYKPPPSFLTYPQKDPKLSCCMLPCYPSFWLLGSHLWVKQISTVSHTSPGRALSFGLPFSLRDPGAPDLGPQEFCSAAAIRSLALQWLLKIPRGLRNRDPLGPLCFSLALPDLILNLIVTWNYSQIFFFFKKESFFFFLKRKYLKP